ncbi:hypothetical protein ARSEF1564_009010 [Beauveria bassiana]
MNLAADRKAAAQRTAVLSALTDIVQSKSAAAKAVACMTFSTNPFGSRVTRSEP